jgi:hypothetical protein
LSLIATDLSDPRGVPGEIASDGLRLPLTFRIPEEQQRRWESADMENGVLRIRYLKDEEEEEGKGEVNPIA